MKEEKYPYTEQVWNTDSNVNAIFMDNQDVQCHCCGWQGNTEDTEYEGVCPKCGQRGSLQTDG